jgi:hypothetical protein
MAGISGPAIGTNAANPNPIGGAALVTADGAAVGEGSLENFIGFGYDATSQEPLPVDFSAANNTVTVGRTLQPQQEPTYTAIPGNTLDETLLWATPAP